MTQALPAPKAVIWDWDDTLVETWPVIHAAINKTLVAFGRAPWSVEELRANLGPPARVLFTGLFGEERWQEADAIYIDAYKSSIDGNLRMLEDAGKTLQKFAAHKIPQVIASAKRGPILQYEVKMLGLDALFSGVVGAGDALKDKPHVEATLLALKDTGITPGPDVWVIGDSMTDMLMAKNAGCTAVLIETKLPSEEALAQNAPAARFRAHEDILKFLDTMFHKPAGNIVFKPIM